MDNILLYLLVILIMLVTVLIVILIFKKPKEKMYDDDMKLYFEKEYNDLKIEMIDLINRSNKNNYEYLGNFQTNVGRDLNDKINSLNNKLDSKLGESLTKTNDTFVNVIERLTKIDETQKNLTSLSDEIMNLNNILSDKQLRGSFGEVQLNQILYAIMGNNKELYEKQKTLSNNRVVDAIIYAPKPLGNISIDSKFPLENYSKMINVSNKTDEYKKHSRLFKNDIKKHIDDISSKYIIIKDTSEFAIMFIPSEAVFSEIVTNHQDLIQYSYKKNVWLVSPTTLVSTITIVQTMFSSNRRNENATKIIDELKLLAIEFERYIDRWDRLKRSADSLYSNINDVNITSEKISNRFKDISDTNF